jgi:hypothetical protein
MALLMKGFHDVAEVCLLVTNEEELLASKLLHCITLVYLRGKFFCCVL